MSAYSTLKITRKKAREELIKVCLGEFDDKLLEEFMDHLLEPRLYNTIIVADDAPNDDNLV